MNILRFLIPMLALGFLCACEEQPVKPVQPSSDRQIKESLERANRYLANEEEEEINYYVRRHQLEMVSTGTGLRYQVLEKGEGSLVQAGQTVTMEYVLYDLTGEEIYSSEKDGLMHFLVGRSDVPSGLDEAVRLLHVGDRACVIVPSHLGYGLLGDQNAIPSRATLIYILKIIKVE